MGNFAHAFAAYLEEEKSMDYVPYPFNLLLMVLILKTSLWGDLLLNGALCALTARNEWVYSRPDTEKIPKRMMLGTLAVLLAQMTNQYGLFPLNLALYGLLNLYLLYCGGKLWQLQTQTAGAGGPAPEDNRGKKTALLFWLHAGFSLFLIALELYFRDVVW